MTTRPFRWLTLALAAGLALTLAACATTTTPAASSTPPPSQGWAKFLPRYQWQLTQATDAKQQPISALTEPARAIEARFGADDARLSISGGCNQMNGSYQVSDTGALTLSQMASTRRACVGPLMQVDAALGAVLAQAQQLSLVSPDTQAPRFTMRAADGSALLWAGKLTPEARYGASTTVFYEVGPERLTCPHPLMPNARCLQVREIKYDAQGLAIGVPGAWQNLYQEIEGYTHTPGQRQVLRIKKFQRPQPLPADASSIVLVLDMVVRSETIAK